MQNAGLTPLEGTLFTIRDYFQGGIADAARGGAIPVPPNSCGKNFSVVLTNGLPSVTRFGVPSSDVASMLSAATTAAAAIQTAGVLNYIVGFALPFGVNPAQLDTIAAAGGTGSSYYATDEATLISELNAVFNDILIRSGAAGAVALNSGSIQTNSRLFQAKFNTGDWSGQLQAFPIDSSHGCHRRRAVGRWRADQRAELEIPGAPSSPTTRCRGGACRSAGPPIRRRPLPRSSVPAQVLALEHLAAGGGGCQWRPRLQYMRGDHGQ